MGGCAMIGQSIINVGSGGRRRLSGVVAALGLIFFILVGLPLISRMPIAPLIISALAFAWQSAKRIRKFDVRNDPPEIIIDFKESRIVDHSAIEAINKVTVRYSRAGKKLHLRHLSEDCRLLLDNASSLIEINHWEDPRYILPLDQWEAAPGKSKKPLA